MITKKIIVALRADSAVKKAFSSAAIRENCYIANILKVLTQDSCVNNGMTTTERDYPLAGDK